MAGNVVTYTISISNPNQIAKTYTIDCQSDWTCDADATELTLEAGESTDIDISVTIPTDAEAGDTNVSEATATSTAYPSLTATLSLTTTVEEEITAVSLSRFPIDKEIWPKGKSCTLTRTAD